MLPLQTPPSGYPWGFFIARWSPQARTIGNRGNPLTKVGGSEMTFVPSIGTA
jgi:hypothetical protein